MSLEKIPSFLLNFSEVDMRSENGLFYQFKSFRLNLAERQLLNESKPVSLTPKAFDVLAVLIEQAGHLVEKDELMRLVWPDSFVEEANVSRIVHTLRRALNEDENGNKFIETVAKKGYRFVAQVTEGHELSSQELVIGDPAEAVEELSRTISLPTGETAVLPAIEIEKRPTRFVLIATGFFSAVALIFWLSFNFHPKSSESPSDLKSIRVSLPTRYSANDEAYRLYLLGSALVEKRNREDTRKAIQAFEEAIRGDPDYAPAYAGLANAHSALAIMGGGGNTTEEYLKAKTAVEKSLALDETLAEAHTYLGELKLNFEYDFAGAEREHRRAVELEPNSAAAHRMYALLLGFLGRSDESIAQIKTAIDLEPASVLNHKIYGQLLYYARRYDDSIAEGKRTVELDANFPDAYDALIESYRKKGDDNGAFEWFVRELERNTEDSGEIQLWKAIYSQSGWRGIFERQLDQAKAKEAEKNGNVNAMPLARLYIKLDERDQSFAYLEKALDKRSWAMVSLKVNPSFDSLRSDVRFDDLLKRIGLE